MSHVHAFPCIHSFFSIYSDIFELHGTFLIVFFSLSLSSVYVSALMAPKRKSALPRKDFSENFSRRGVHSERQVILSDFSDTDLPIVIHNRGWESLCDIPVTCPFMLI